MRRLSLAQPKSDALLNLAIVVRGSPLDTPNSEDNSLDAHRARIAGSIVGERHIGLDGQLHPGYVPGVPVESATLDLPDIHAREYHIHGSNIGRMDFVDGVVTKATRKDIAAYNAD